MEWMDLLTNFANLFAFSSSIEGLSKFCNYGNSNEIVFGGSAQTYLSKELPIQPKALWTCKVSEMWSDSHLYQKSHWEPTSSWISQRLSSNTWLDYEKELHNILVFTAFSIMKCPQPHIRESLHIEKKSNFHCTWGVVVVEIDGINSCPDFSNWLENVDCMKFSNPNQCVALCCVWKSSNWQKGWKSIVCSVDPIDLSGNVQRLKKISALEGYHLYHRADWMSGTWN